MENKKSVRPTSTDLPSLMQVVHKFYCKEATEPDWLDVFRRCDPRKPFTTELCKACYSKFADVDCSTKVIHVIKRDETDIIQLMLFFYDGTCACAAQGVPKTRLDICLLDVIAASGSVEALRAYIIFIENRAAFIETRKSTDICQGSTFVCGFPKSKSTAAALSDAQVDSKPEENENDSEQTCYEETTKISMQRKDFVNAHCLSDSNAGHGASRLLLSPDCRGGHVERRPFPLEESFILEDDVSDPELASGSLQGTLLHRNSNVSEANDMQNKSARCSDPVHSKDQTCSLNKLFAISDSSNVHTELSVLSSSNCSLNGADLKVGLEWVFNASAPDGNCCPLACSFPQEAVDSLKKHLDQTTLLSMAAQALYHNHEIMMVCARALTPASISELVSMCINFRNTEAMLSLYFMSFEENDKFAEVSDDDWEQLCRCTLPVEVSRLCQLAWQDVPPTEYFSRARNTTIYIDLCKNCEKQLFPDNELYGKTSYVKFWRNHQKNTALFECIRTGGCECSNKTGSYVVYPELTAAASGNAEMFKILSEPFLTDKIKRSKRGDHTDNRHATLKPCTKGFKSQKHPGIAVGFNAEVEHFGESRKGAALRHALYGGNDDIVLYILSQMNPWPLQPEESIACLQMCLLMSRDDMFFRLTLQANLDTGSSTFTKCRQGTPLMMAASHGRMLLVNLLLARGASPMLENLYGVTAIEMALQSSYEDSELIALRMLSVVSDLDLGKTLITSALIYNKLRVAGYLCSQGVKTAYSRPTAWIRVRSLAELEVPLVQWWLTTNTSLLMPQVRTVLKFLLSQGLEVNTRDARSGITPLHTAAMRDSDIETLELLLSYGARVNARTTDGATPLYNAVQINHLANVACLVRAGASLCNPDSKLFNMALSLRQFKVILLLLHAGYRPSLSDQESLTLLGPRVPEPCQVLISSVRSEPLPLPTLCAASLREALQGELNNYLDTVRCPDMVRRFIHLEHLFQKFFDPDSWNRILQWEQ